MRASLRCCRIRNHRSCVIIGERINKKCLSTKASYITRRMSLQLLSTILLKRTNYNVMMLYITSADNLVTILCLQLCNIGRSDNLVMLVFALRAKR